jgi:hypothetical protein
VIVFALFGALLVVEVDLNQRVLIFRQPAWISETAAILKPA